MFVILSLRVATFTFTQMPNANVYISLAGDTNIQTARPSAEELTPPHESNLSSSPATLQLPHS